MELDMKNQAKGFVKDHLWLVAGVVALALLLLQMETVAADGWVNNWDEFMIPAALGGKRRAKGFLKDYPRLTAGLFTLVLLLSQAGMVLAGETGGGSGGP